MSDSLKDRLNSHSNSFEGLLSLIPARYYYEDENQSQWKKKRGHANAEERTAEIAQNKRNKFDPEVGSSALDEVKRRENAIQQNNQNAGLADDDDDDVIVYDLNGNPVGEEKEETVAELLKAKSLEAGAEGSENKGNKASSKAKKSQRSATTPKEPKPLDEKSNDNNSTFDVSAASNSSPNGDLNEPVTKPVNESKKTATDPKKPKSKEGIEELRAKLTARVQELRAVRKAPGSNALGAPKNREELLAARKKRLEQKKLQGVKCAAPESDSDEADNDETIASDISSIADTDSSFIFGQIQFGDGARLGKTGSEFENRKNIKKRNAADQLKVLEQRKDKISKLNSDKQKKIAENAQWSRAILQSEGAKVRDDETLLRRTIKQNENQKKRSEKEWKQRLYNVKKGISDREAKRNTNIRARKEAKNLRLKGKKRRDHMKNAGAK